MPERLVLLRVIVVVGGLDGVDEIASPVTLCLRSSPPGARW